MKYLLSLIFILTFGVSIGQIYNPTPQYVYKYKLGASRSTPVDTAAYMNIGPNTGGISGIMLPRVDDTASITGTKRNGLLIFSNQLNRFAWYDSANAVWTGLGSGGTATDDATVLINGGTTIGDTLLVSNIAGDTLTLMSLLAGSGILFENMGDTLLKINIDSSTTFNIYNSDGTISGVYRTVFIDSVATTNLGLVSPDYLTGIEIQSHFITQDGSVRIFANSRNLLGESDISLINIGSDSAMAIIIRSNGTNNGAAYSAEIQIFDKITFSGDLGIYSVAEATTSTPEIGKYTLLNDLSGANGTVTLRTTSPITTGAIVHLFNNSSDATYKWSPNITIKTIAGGDITVFDDKTFYTLMFDGTNWIIINKYQ